MELKKETMDIVEDGIVLQMERLSEPDLDGAYINHVASAASNLLDKMVNLKQQEESAVNNAQRNDNEREKIEIEKRKIEVEADKNATEKARIEAQKEVELARLEVQKETLAFEKVKFEYEQKDRDRQAEYEDKKAESAYITAMASYERNDTEVKTAEIRSKAEVDKAKVEINWKRLAIEGLKIVGPMVTGAIAMRIWSDKMDDVMMFEETGRPVTTAFKLLKFPKLPGF